MALRWEEIGGLIGGEPPPGWSRRGPVGRVECRPEAVRRGDLCCIFPEFHGYQRWWTAEAGLAVVKDREPALVVVGRGIPVGTLPVWRVDDPARACARLARAWHGAPASDFPVCGVTGTNGKTTTVKLMAHLLSACERPAADLGTLGTWMGEHRIEGGDYTTDLAVDLHRKLARVREAGARAAAVEVSSHALALGRVSGISFAAGVLTNVTRDHLEFHGTVEAYRAAKRRLFEGLERDATAVLNADDPAAKEFAGVTRGRVVTFGSATEADLRLEEAAYEMSGTEFRVAWEGRVWRARTPLVGAFQLQNVLAAAAVLLGRGADPDAVWEAVGTFAAVRGRMERLEVPSGAVVVIDYAHNPDGLEQVLRSCRALAPRRLRVVFGCGGDRDRGKRPLMGAVAERWADGGWITSDNPRSEDPGAIMADILSGMSPQPPFAVEVDRAVAIRDALESSRAGDLILIAGKGHEDYQLVGPEKRFFSDHAEVARWAEARSGPSA